MIDIRNRETYINNALSATLPRLGPVSDHNDKVVSEPFLDMEIQ